MSIWVVGVPLPGWKFSALRTTYSWPSTSSTLPLRTWLAMIFNRSLDLAGAEFAKRRRGA